MSDVGYQFRCFLKGHQTDVKCTSISDDSQYLVTVSRDKTCKLWQLNGTRFVDYCTFLIEEGYALVAKFRHFQGVHYVCLAGTNKKLEIRSVLDGSLVFSHKDHQNTINCLDFDGDEILTGSTDHTIIRSAFLGGTLFQYKYHIGAIWCLCVFNDSFFSGSADSVIVRWQNTRVVNTFIGHEGPVRDVKMIQSKQQLISAGNDSTVRLWNLTDATCIKIVFSAKHFIYSLCLFNEAYSFACSGEEKCIKLFKNLELVDEIVVPGVSNWNVNVLNNSDVIVSSNFPDVMIFTKDPDLVASNGEMVEFEECVEASVKSKGVLSGVNLNEIPPLAEGIRVPGKYEGEVKMFRKNNQVVVYEWTKNNEWKYIGNTVSQAEPDVPKTKFKGQEYDHVINVEVGNLVYKLPYNNGDDPSLAAERFLTNNNLEAFYHQEIVDFLKANVPSAKNYDYSKTTSSSVPISLFPKKRFIFFDTTNLSGLINRITSLYQGQYTPDLSKLQKMVDGTINCKNLNLPNDIPLQLLNDLLVQNTELLLPALDVVKQMVLIQEFFEIYFIATQNCFELDLFKFVDKFISDGIDDKCQLLAFRVFSNSMTHSKYAKLFIDYYPLISPKFVAYNFWGNQQLALSLASLIFNYSVIFVSIHQDLGHLVGDFLNSCCFVLEAYGESMDEESLARLLASIANLLTLVYSKPASNFVDILKGFFTTLQESTKYKESVQFIKQKFNF